MRFLRSRDEKSWVIIGLGNPGERYEKTRHNAGVIVLESLLARAGSKPKRHKSGCVVAEGDVGGRPAILARPLSYMNESGRPVRELLRWYKVPSEHLIVVHDEVDIPFGQVRVKNGGGTAGHNGLGSLVNHLGTKDFVRIRTGVGRPRGQAETSDHVLGRFSSSERKELPSLVERASDAVERVVEVGVERAMNEFNTRD